MLGSIFGELKNIKREPEQHSKQEAPNKCSIRIQASTEQGSR